MRYIIKNYKMSIGHEILENNEISNNYNSEINVNNSNLNNTINKSNNIYNQKILKDNIKNIFCKKKHPSQHKLTEVNSPEENRETSKVKAIYINKKIFVDSINHNILINNIIKKNKDKDNKTNKSKINQKKK